MTGAGGNGQLRAFIERVLRMKEEARAINDDVREIYAEAKANGYDKTVLGQVVSFIEKRAKDPQAFAERSALFDLYLAEIGETGTRLALARAHTHEITEPAIRAPDQDVAAGDAVETTASRSTAPIPPETAQSSRVGKSVKPPAEQERSSVAGSLPAASLEDARPLAGSNPAPATTSPKGIERMPGCQHPDACAGMWNKRCFTCERDFTASQPTEPERIMAEMVAQRKALRPHCLRPSNCLGVGKKHCTDCLAAHADAEGFAA